MTSLSLFLFFGLEGDDHDFNEVRSINLFDNENQVIKPWLQRRN